MENQKTANPKNFLFVSISGLIGDIAWQIVKEGHNVKYFIEEAEEKDVADGFVPKVDDWQKEVDWADVICYHKDTEILTKKGWKKFYELDEGDYVATLNKNHELEWQKPTSFIKKLVDEELLGYDSEQINFVVTQKHNMFVKYRKENRKNFSLVSIEEIFGKTHIEFKKDCIWKGENINFIEIDEYITSWKTGGKHSVERTKIFPKRKFLAKEFIKFLGFFIAEGCVKYRWGKKPSTTSIGQNSGKVFEEFKQVLENLNIKYSISRRKNNFNEILIHDSQLANYLIQFGVGASNKRIPDFIKNLSTEFLKELYEWFKRGDGSPRYVSTSSKQLSNDLQEIGLKIGVVLRERVEQPKIMKNGYIPKRCQYILTENKNKKTPEIRDKKRWKKIPYKDFVYCVEVPNHIIYVRYKSAPMWCGNCFDDVLGQGTKAKKLREQGKFVIGGTPYTDKLEDDRAFGQEELKKYGVNILPYKEFTSFDDAINFVKENPGRYVIKPSGEAQNIKGLLFVGEEEDGKDVIQLMDSYRKAWAKKIPVFQLQKRVIGVEVAVGAFFNGKEFIYPINVNFEHKKLFPGELGPPTGEMGTSEFWSGPNRLFNQTLKKMEPKLAEEGYVGYIDINCIVNNYGIYPLEFTSRFGYPTISIQQESMLMPIGDFFYELAKGEKAKLRVKSGFQIGVRIVVPPFPFRDKETFKVKSKDSVIFFKKPTEGIHIEDVKLVNGEWVVTGTSGVVLIVCGTGQTMKQTQAQVYSRIKNIMIPQMYYRTDIGDRWFEDSDKLNTWGYLREV